MTVQTLGNAPTPTAVRLVSGKTATVLTALEAEWFNEARDTYLRETKFTEGTDLKDLDRLLVLELMIFRWTQWLASDSDYVGDMIDPEVLRKSIKEYSDQINKVKESMGLNKKARDDAASEGNLTAYIADLVSRAKIFGVHRENQLTKALVLMNELSAIVKTFERCDAEERAEIGFESYEEIVAWIRGTMLPEFEAIDAYFREHEQRYWVRDL